MPLTAFLNEPRYGRLRGIALMVFSPLAFSGMHTSIKHISGDVDTFIIVFFRNLFGFLVLLPLLLRSGIAPLRTKRLGTHLMRVTINFASMAMFFYALSITPPGGGCRADVFRPDFRNLPCHLHLPGKRRADTLGCHPDRVRRDNRRPAARV